VRRVLTALGGTAGERGLAFDGLEVVRRCADLEDLLVAAATGVAQAVLLSPYVVGLDRDALSRLRTMGLAVIGVTAPGDERAERRLRQLGVDHVHAGAAGVETLAELVHGAVEGRGPAVAGFANPFAALPVPVPLAARDGGDPGSGRVVAVWGPTGAPGRTTVATGLAGELALLGWPVLLVDADVYGGSVAPRLGLLDESSGLASACRAANLGALDVPGLAGLAQAVAPGLSVLTGIASAERWPELRPAAVARVLTLARRTAAVTVVDCGFSLEQDEELSYDTLAPRRNGATLAVLAEADLVVAVGGADSVGLQRLARGLDELAQVVPGVPKTVVVNRVRGSVLPEREVREVLRRDVGVEQVTVVPADVPAVDGAAGRVLATAAPASPARLALRQLAASLVGAAVPHTRRRLLRR
jgi:Flp pilus assembly CpaE family ATPase